MFGFNFRDTRAKRFLTLARSSRRANSLTSSMLIAFLFWYWHYSVNQLWIKFSARRDPIRLFHRNRFVISSCLRSEISRERRLLHPDIFFLLQTISVIRLSTQVPISGLRGWIPNWSENSETPYKVEPRYQILPWLFRAIDQSVLRSDAPTIIRGLPKFIERADWSLTYFLPARTLSAQKVTVIGATVGKGERKRERERERGGERFKRSAD